MGSGTPEEGLYGIGDARTRKATQLPLKLLPEAGRE